jgi:hypothetical protein
MYYSTAATSLESETKRMNIEPDVADWITGIAVPLHRRGIAGTRPFCMGMN